MSLSPMIGENIVIGRFIRYKIGVIMGKARCIRGYSLSSAAKRCKANRVMALMLMCVPVLRPRSKRSIPWGFRWRWLWAPGTFFAGSSNQQRF